MELYAEPVEVERGEGQEALPAPRAFVLRGERYEVTRVLRVWADAGFADRRRGKHGWWERRHRNYWRVETAGGDTWDLYLDRGAGRRRWFVSRRWPAGDAPPP